MDPGNLNPIQRTAGNKRVSKLAYLISFRQVRIKIILTVKFCVVSKRALECKPDLQYFSDRFPVNNRQGPGVCETNWTNIPIRASFVRIITGTTEHFGLRLELCMYLETYRRYVFAHRGHCSTPSPKFSICNSQFPIN